MITSKMCNNAIFIILLNCVLCINAFTVLNFKHPTTRYGFVYPNRAEPNRNITYVLEGVDVLISLAKVPENYEACKITTPDTEVTYTLVPGGVNDKVEFWSPNSNPKECGARIKNVTIQDSGRWRLQAINAEQDYKIQSFINLQVKKNFDRENPNFQIRKDEKGELNITNLANYCQISNPHISGSYNVYDDCLIALENVNRLYGGTWKVSVGVYGKIDEIRLEPNVTVLEENFDVGTNKTGSKINLYCNIQNAPNTTDISFCRFIKNNQDIGLRLNEGLSNGKYSYYGRSLKDGDCGVTIEKPDSSDYVAWKCTIGLYRNKGDKKLEKYEVKESVISLQQSRKRKQRSINEQTRSSDEYIEDVLGGIGHPLTISYKTDFRIKYCVVKHPNGTLFPINTLIKNEKWFSVGDLNVGVCTFTLNNASKNETGVWQIQMGHYDIHELDEVKKVNVRIGDMALVAAEQKIETSLDAEITLKCKSVGSLIALEYCRFSLPNGEGFQINEAINQSNSIDDLYWYKKSATATINNGVCQVTINRVGSEHLGTWTCAAKIMDSEIPEDYDYIHVTTGGLTVASISGIVVGAALAVILTGAVFVYYRRRKNRQQPQRRQTYLSTSSQGSHEITHAERVDPGPLVTVEEEQQPEEIEMAPVERIEIEPTEQIELEEIRRPTSTSEPGQTNDPIFSVSGRQTSSRSHPESQYTSF